MAEQEREANNEEEDLGPEPAPYDNAKNWKEPLKREEKPNEVSGPEHIDTELPADLEDRGE